MSASPVPGAKPMLVFIIAGEESGDRLGAGLMQALKQRCGESVRFVGVGGEAMGAEGLRSLFPLERLSIVGFRAVLLRLLPLLRLIGRTARAVVEADPDILVLIDSPDFTHRVARQVRSMAPGIPIIDYVSPTVWAWRSGRSRAMRAYVDHVLAILPFEPEAHRRLGGPPCTYIGHPLVEQVAQLRPAASDWTRREADPPVVLVLPGSRRGEIRRHMEPFGRALDMTRQQTGPIELILPTVGPVRGEVEAAVAAWSVKPKVISDRQAKLAAFRMARAALAASGTVTLELALAAVPMVAAYRIAAWEAALARRLIRVPSVILPNLILGEQAIPELLQERCVPERLAASLVGLLRDTPTRRSQLQAFARLDQVMEIGIMRPSERAASIVLAAARSELGGMRRAV
jgi:lipid-A-disaccharide synthase